MVGRFLQSQRSFLLGLSIWAALLLLFAPSLGGQQINPGRAVNVANLIGCSTTSSVLQGGATPACTTTPTVVTLTANTLESTGNVKAATTGAFLFGSLGGLKGSGTDGVMRLVNDAQTDFSRLQFGGTTSSFPSIKRSAAQISFRLADDSADAVINSGGLNMTGSMQLSNPSSIYWGSRSTMKSPADGTLALGNNAETNVVNVVVSSASTGRVIQWGTGTPEGVVTASIGSLYMDIAGGAATTLYVKTSGTGNTGWTAK